MKRRMLILILMGVLALGLGSCGGGGNGVGTISSSSGGTFSPAIGLIEADLATWTGTPCGANSTYTIPAANVASITFTAFSAPAGSTGNTPEQVVIDRVSVIYTPSSTGSPALPTQYQAIAQTVALGSSVTFPVEVAPLAIKMSPTMTSLICPVGISLYSYYATLVFDCHYLISGNTFSGSTQVNVKFSDFI